MYINEEWNNNNIDDIYDSSPTLVILLRAGINNLELIDREKKHTREDIKCVS